MSSVRLENICKSFGKVDVIRNISLDIKDHEFTVFVGPSGCGKSTLLRLIAGLEDISSGKLFIGEEEVSCKPPAKRGVAMVFQSYALYPHMTVYENIAFGIRSLAKDSIKQSVVETAKILRIQDLLERKPKELSGGQRQRVAIGRAIIRHPKVFLFDEPLSNLDAALRVEMRMQIARIKADLNKTMIYVTHDQVEAMTLADKIVVLQNGIIEQVGSPLELYHCPHNQFVAGFLGSPRMNFVDVSLQSFDGKELKLDLGNNKSLKLEIDIHPKAHIKAGQSLTLGIRPEHVQECEEQSALLSGQVRVVEHLGSEIYAYIRLINETSLMVRTNGDHKVQPGDVMHFRFEEKFCHIFHSETGLSLNASCRF